MGERGYRHERANIEADRPFIELEGVAGRRGDSGQHVWIYSTPEATAEEVSEARSAMQAEPSVARVEGLK